MVFGRILDTVFVLIIFNSGQIKIINNSCYVNRLFNNSQVFKVLVNNKRIVHGIYEKREREMVGRE